MLFCPPLHAHKHAPPEIAPARIRGAYFLLASDVLYDAGRVVGDGAMLAVDGKAVADLWRMMLGGVGFVLLVITVVVCFISEVVVQCRVCASLVE
jgi:hypothetical protein